MQLICVLPVRLRSSRFPRRALAKYGATSLVEHGIELALGAFGEAGLVFIATPDEEVIDIAQRTGVRALRVSSDHPTAFNSTRECVGQLRQSMDLTNTYIVEYWIDEPTLSRQCLRDTAERCSRSKSADVLTCISHPKTTNQLNDVERVKAFVDDEGIASHFTRAPYVGANGAAIDVGQKIHVGAFAFRPGAIEMVDRYVREDPGASRFTSKGGCIMAQLPIAAGLQRIATMEVPPTESICSPKDIDAALRASSSSN